MMECEHITTCAKPATLPASTGLTPPPPHTLRSAVHPRRAGSKFWLRSRDGHSRRGKPPAGQPS
ncbi:hypothetical protein C0Q70_05932 [Pomacea canaliculata]|uniref:Uncharacterized protein n=1 Tax=Pomacea canaliculata TaxID=400727 RepID=A0A2T7PML3_POMCA|nr:hypothetical protein C0Q70_05932 [Pomacea canaliculata]